jgi:hypothetical protein
MTFSPEQHYVQKEKTTAFQIGHNCIAWNNTLSRLQNLFAYWLIKYNTKRPQYNSAMLYKYYYYICPNS